MRLAAFAAAAGLVMTGSVSHAQPADLTPEAMAAHLAEVGAWDFAARKYGSDGRPECSETWYFDADGTGRVQSGEQEVTFSWRTAQGVSSDRWVYRTSLTTTTGPDCMGNVADPSAYPRKESGFVVMFFNSGTAMTCRPAAYLRNKDGTPSDTRFLRDEDCWGTLNPVKPK